LFDPNSNSQGIRLTDYEEDYGMLRMLETLFSAQFAAKQHQTDCHYCTDSNFSPAN